MTVAPQRRMQVDLEGRVFIVTGAGGAIGSAVARRLAANGAKLTVCDLETPRALREELGEGAEAAAMDVRRPESVRALVSACQARFRSPSQKRRAASAVPGQAEMTSP